MTALQTAINKYQWALEESGHRRLTDAEVKSFEAGWNACVVEYRKAEEEDYEEEAQKG